MFDRALLSDAEGDHRRHWLLCDFPEAWCKLSGSALLGPKKTFQTMKTQAPDVLGCLESALHPNASASDIERAIHAIAGPRVR